MLSKIVRTLLASALVLLGANASAQSPRKVALVVANGTYSHAGQLANPINDAQLVGQALRRANFATIQTRSNLNLASFQSALREFAAYARGADIALIYFAGHGMEANGQNWLIPVDARLATDTDLEFEAIKLDSALRAVEGARVRIVALDACRDNPFAVSMRRFSPVRAVSRGLVGVEADDVLVMYAAAHGQTAADGSGANSPFARALSARISEPGLELRLMAGKIRDDVLLATNGRQRPFISASISGVAQYIVAPPANAYSPSAAEAAYWRVCCEQTTTQRRDIEVYLREVQNGVFPGSYTERARQRLAGGNTPATNPSQTFQAPGDRAKKTVTFAPRGEVTQPDGQVCRTLSTSVTEKGRPKMVEETYCRSADGRWAPRA